MPNPAGILYPDEAREKRIRDFELYMHRNPGARPNGTGSTGLMSGDARGYSDLLNRQTQYLNDKSAAAGRGPMNIREGVSMGSSQQRRPSMEALDVFADRPVWGGGIDLSKDLALEQIRGARAANRGAENANFLFESESLPYGTSEQRTAQDLERRGAIGDFTREESGKNLDQRLEEYFNSGNQGMLDDQGRRTDERVSHAAGEQRETLLGRDRIDAGSRVAAEGLESGQRGEAERLGSIIELLKLAAAAPAGPGGTPNPVGGRALEMIDRLEGGGAQGGDPGKTVSRAEVEAYAREKGRNVAQVEQELKGRGYVVR